MPVARDRKQTRHSESRELRPPRNVVSACRTGSAGAMNSIIYIVGLIVIVLVVLSLF
jgi:hypothetical protein